jgi:hypothetical protein
MSAFLRQDMHEPASLRDSTQDMLTAMGSREALA